MFFSIKNSLDWPIDIAKAQVRNIARRRIMRFPMKAAEIVLQNYLQSEHKATLKVICLELLTHCEILFDRSKNIIVKFGSQEDDQLASFITYGDLEHHGSAILQEAFKD